MALGILAAAVAAILALIWLALKDWEERRREYVPDHIYKGIGVFYGKTIPSRREIEYINLGIDAAEGIGPLRTSYRINIHPFERKLFMPRTYQEVNGYADIMSNRVYVKLFGPHTLANLVFHELAHLIYYDTRGHENQNHEDEVFWQKIDQGIQLSQ